jgi:5-methyltetrahydrofolate--homocysteine methyltransferase
LDPIPVREVVPYINWKFFFHAWKLSARFHTVTKVGKDKMAREAWLSTFREVERERALEAARLYDDAQIMLSRFIRKEVDYVKALFGLYEAWSDEDTIYLDGTPFPLLRQQVRSDAKGYLCLSDFVAPNLQGIKDYAAVFAVTAGAGAGEQLKRYEEEGDDYNGLLMRSLLDRLAEATTEWLHAEVRRTYWGYAQREALSVEEMFAVKYVGIRPAVGYSSIPDQSANFILHDLLDSHEIGISLTENGAMYPNASVSGLFLAHPESKYFAIGEIDDEQLADYARRKGVPVEALRKFLL